MQGLVKKTTDLKDPVTSKQSELEILWWEFEAFIELEVKNVRTLAKIAKNEIIRSITSIIFCWQNEKGKEEEEEEKKRVARNYKRTE